MSNKEEKCPREFAAGDFDWIMPDEIISRVKNNDYILNDFPYQDLYNSQIYIDNEEDQDYIGIAEVMSLLYDFKKVSYQRTLVKEVNSFIIRELEKKIVVRTISLEVRNRLMVLSPEIIYKDNGDMVIVIYKYLKDKPK